MSLPEPEGLRQRVRTLGLYGLLARFEEVAREPWLLRLVEDEEAERARRSLERRLKRSKIGRFKPIADFDWSWPKRIDRELVLELLALGFVREHANAILIGPNGVGKSMIAQNLAHQALVAGFTVLRTTASEMLNDLAAQDSSSALNRRLRRYCNPALLVVDEVGYLSYDPRAGDLLFEVVSRRHEQKSIVLTTNRPFVEWNQVFPSASCITAMVDRLVHKAEIVRIEGESYRAKEAKERLDRKTKERGGRSASTAKSGAS